MGNSNLHAADFGMRHDKRKTPESQQKMRVSGVDEE